MIFPNAVLSVAPPVINSMSSNCIGGSALGLQCQFSNPAAWPVASEAFFLPFRITSQFVSAYVYWINGATVGHNNVDVGVYDSQGNRLGSIGNTATSGVSAVQKVALALTLNPGLYYLAMVSSGTTDTFYADGQAKPTARACGIYMQTSASPLPATATFAANTAAYIPFVGITTQSVA